MIRNQILKVVNRMVGKKSDGGFARRKFRNGAPTTRRNYLSKMTEQVRIERASGWRRSVNKDAKARRKEHARKRFGVALASACSAVEIPINGVRPVRGPVITGRQDC